MDLRESRTLTAASLVAVNLVPLAGVLFLGWDLFAVVVLYWLENAVIGIFNLIRIAAARGELAVKLFRMPFFAVHYGIFWVVHGAFVMLLFGPGGLGASGRFGLPRSGFTPLDILSFDFLASLTVTHGWALAGMTLSHGLSLATNYFGRREYARTTVDKQMFQPYQRVMVLHVSIIAGGWVTMLLGAPALALVVLVGLKIGVDVRAHLREHRDPASAG